MILAIIEQKSSDFDIKTSADQFYAIKHNS
jgi:hypothetical protein